VPHAFGVIFGVISDIWMSGFHIRSTSVLVWYKALYLGEIHMPSSLVKIGQVGANSFMEKSKLVRSEQVFYDWA